MNVLILYFVGIFQLSGVCSFFFVVGNKLLSLPDWLPGKGKRVEKVVDLSVLLSVWVAVFLFHVPIVFTFVFLLGIAWDIYSLTSVNAASRVLLVSRF